MRDSLRTLMELMPPIPNQRYTTPDWIAFESATGFVYPNSFREFVAIYGASCWFGNLFPITPPIMPAEPRRLEAFLEFVHSTLSWIPDLPLFPKQQGLFPFINDRDGPIWCWYRNENEPEAWPIYVWDRGPIFVLENKSICEILLGFLQRETDVIALMGDVSAYDPKRIRIDDCAAD